MMTCRRCRGSIVEGQVANLVRTGVVATKNRLFDELFTAMIVCTPCLLPKEMGFSDTELPEGGEELPPVAKTKQLTGKQAYVLNLIAAGFVARYARGIMREDPGTHTLWKESDTGYELLAKRAFEWEEIPKEHRVEEGPYALARITFTGRELLEEAQAAALVDA